MGRFFRKIKVIFYVFETNKLRTTPHHFANASCHLKDHHSRSESRDRRDPFGPQIESSIGGAGPKDRGFGSERFLFL